MAHSIGNGVYVETVQGHIVLLTRRQPGIGGKVTDQIFLNRENVRQLSIFLFGNTIEGEISKRQCEIVGGHLGTERE